MCVCVCSLGPQRAEYRELCEEEELEKKSKANKVCVAFFTHHAKKKAFPPSLVCTRGWIEVPISHTVIMPFALHRLPSKPKVS